MVVGALGAAGCVIGPVTGPAGPTDQTFHVVVWNTSQRGVIVGYDGTGSGFAASFAGGAAGCEATVFDGEMTDTWEVKVDGRHVIGTADRPDLGKGRGIRELTVEVDVTRDATATVRSIHPGAAPAVDHLRLPCPAGAPTS